MRSESLLLQDPLILNWMRDSVLRNLITSSSTENLDLRSKLNLLKVNSYFANPTVALLECSGSSIGVVEREREHERIRSCLRQYMSEDSVIFKDGDDRIGLLFSWESHAALRSLKARISDCCSSPVNVGVGQPCNRLSEIHHSYDQASQALQDKFYRGTGQLIFFTELDTYVALQEYPFTQEKELYNWLKSAESIPEMEQGIEEFYRRLMKNGPIGIQQVHEMTIRLLTGMEKRMLSDTMETVTGLRYEIMSIVKMETLQEIIQFVALYLSNLREWMAREDRDSHRNIIKKTIFYMEQECQDACLDSMARKVYMTPTYLSMLFKANTGRTFIEQLTEIRIGKAKEMLKNTCLRNYEVAEKVGYHDSRYFSQLFKKRVGISPSEYRELAGG